MAVSDTIHTLRGVTPEPKHIDGAETCWSGHPWRPETTRWRYRARGGRHGSGWERDCLVCKDMADKARAARRGRNQQLLVDLAAAGEHWTTKGGTA